MRPLPAFGVALLFALAAAPSHGQTLTRAEAVAIAETFVNHTWQAKPVHARHGKDSDGVEIHTPDQAGGRAQPEAEAWVVNRENIRVPYK